MNEVSINCLHFTFLPFSFANKNTQQQRWSWVLFSLQFAINWVLSFPYVLHSIDWYKKTLAVGLCLDVNVLLMNVFFLVWRKSANRTWVLFIVKFKSSNGVKCDKSNSNKWINNSFSWYNFYASSVNLFFAFSLLRMAFYFYCNQQKPYRWQRRNTIYVISIYIWCEIDSKAGTKRIEQFNNTFIALICRFYLKWETEGEEKNANL